MARPAFIAAPVLPLAGRAPLRSASSPCPVRAAPRAGLVGRPHAQPRLLRSGGAVGGLVIAGIVSSWGLLVEGGERMRGVGAEARLRREAADAQRAVVGLEAKLRELVAGMGEMRERVGESGDAREEAEDENRRVRREVEVLVGEVGGLRRDKARLEGSLEEMRADMGRRDEAAVEIAMAREMEVAAVVEGLEEEVEGMRGKLKVAEVGWREAEAKTKEGAGVIAMLRSEVTKGRERETKLKGIVAGLMDKAGELEESWKARSAAFEVATPVAGVQLENGEEEMKSEEEDEIAREVELLEKQQKESDIEAMLEAKAANKKGKTTTSGKGFKPTAKSTAKRAASASVPAIPSGLISEADLMPSQRLVASDVNKEIEELAVARQAASPSTRETPPVSKRAPGRPKKNVPKSRTSTKSKVTKSNAASATSKTEGGKPVAKRGPGRPRKDGSPPRSRKASTE